MTLYLLPWRIKSRKKKPRKLTQLSSGDGLHISTLLTVRSCTIMYCTYNYVFSVNKILFKPSSRSHPRHLVGKKTAQKDTIIDITSDSQVNSNFPYRWSPASLTFNNYFYLFLYLYI